MPKVNFNALPPPVYRTKTATYTDPAAPGVEVTFTLRALVDEHGNPDQFRIALAQERADAFAAKFGETGFPVGESSVPIGKTFAETLAYLEVRQDGLPDDTYTLEELVGFARSMPAALRQVSEDAAALDAETTLPEGELPNS